MWLKYALSFSAIILGVLATYIYIFSKKEAYRFFYPALVLFVFFSLVPISYSVYVSFTNLKTGHLLTRDAVLELLKSETVIESNSLILNSKFIKYPDHYLLIVDNLGAQFRDKDSVTELGPLALIPPGGKELLPYEIYEIIKKNSTLEIIHPGLGTYHFLRTDALAKTKPRFIDNSDGTLKDTLTRENLVEDKDNGLFKLEGEQVGPGYYTNVGFSNYKELFLNPEVKFVFFKSFFWTFSWAFFSVALTFIVGSFLAVTLNEMGDKSKLIYRMLFIIPYSIPFFISVLLFKGMLNKDFGEINHWLSFFKISPIPWLEHKMWAKVSVLLVNLWLGFPYMLLVITGILQSIPKSLYEASSLEGASRLQNFRFLTFPIMFKAMIPLLIGSFAFNLNNFVGIYLLTGGGPVISEASTPLGETDILISYTYRLAFEGSQGQNFALAAAVSMLIFILVVALTFLNFKISKKVSEG